MSTVAANPGWVWPRAVVVLGHDAGVLTYGGVPNTPPATHPGQRPQEVGDLRRLPNYRRHSRCYLVFLWGLHGRHPLMFMSLFLNRKFVSIAIVAFVAFDVI